VHNLQIPVGTQATELRKRVQSGDSILNNLHTCLPCASSVPTSISIIFDG